MSLLAELVSHAEGKPYSNLPAGQCALSDGEATRLFELLDEYQKSDNFLKSAYFVEGLAGGEVDSDAIREIYLSRRKQRGRTRAMASTHWSLFLDRIGMARNMQRPVGYNTMSYNYFRKMETILLRSNNIDPRIRSIILSVIDTYRTDVEGIRSGNRNLSLGTISQLPKRIMDQLSMSQGTVSTAQVSGLMTVLADMSVLFSTRDWTVAGTLSTIAGGIAATTYK